jgi:hypothetical protein
MHSHLQPAFPPFCFIVCSLPFSRMVLSHIRACRMVLCGHVAGGPASHSAIPHGLVLPRSNIMCPAWVCGLVLRSHGAAVLPTALPRGPVSSSFDKLRTSYGADGCAGWSCGVLCRMVRRGAGLCGALRGCAAASSPLFLHAIPSAIPSRYSSQSFLRII